MTDNNFDKQEYLNVFCTQHTLTDILFKEIASNIEKPSNANKK